MIVYGDSERVARPGERLAQIGAALARYREDPVGIGAHAQLVGAFIALSEVVQAIADLEMAAAGGVDVGGRGEVAGNRLLLRLALQVGNSWEHGLRPTRQLEDCRDALEQLDPGLPLRMRQAEGHLHYALYPEGFSEAARRSGLGPDTRVIGLRSIGTGLAAMVAAGLGAQQFWTLRPVGHPFARTVVPGPELARQLLHPDSIWAAVDEGPGKSGSSFGGLVDWLEANGVSRDRIHLFPSHGGEPGEAARPEHRRRWSSLSRHVSGFTGEQVRERLTAWLPDLLGSLDEPLVEISGGGWRCLSGSAAPADRQMEKLKFIARAGGERFLVKFAGLGEAGERKLVQARLLAEHRFVPEPIGLLHGFMVERWVDGQPLPQAQFSRAAFLARAATYLAARATQLRAAHRGASPAELAEMTAINLGERLGPAAGDAARRLLAALADLSATTPVVTDNRLHAWEWLARPDGSFCKTDALDHASSHDLIRCQPVEWDLAGLAVEFDLDPAERRDVLAAVRAHGVTVNAAAVPLMELCYLGFQIGLWTDALWRAEGEDRTRIEALVSRYAGRASRLLGDGSKPIGNSRSQPEFAAQ